jgi:hypothetical protein
MRTTQEEVIQEWEAANAVEAARVTVVRAAEASAQEGTTAWEGTMTLVRDAEDCNTPSVTVATTLSLQCFYNAFHSRNLVEMSFKFKFEFFLNYPI